MNVRFIVGACLYSVVLRRTIASTTTTTTASAVMADAESTGNESYVAGTHSAAFVTVPNMDVAKTLARGAVEKKLAACVNIIPSITSVYEWEGKINEDSELLLMIKTRTSKVDELSKYVRENHPYEVCEVISLPIENGNPPYLKWLGGIVPK